MVLTHAYRLFAKYDAQLLIWFPLFFDYPLRLPAISDTLPSNRLLPNLLSRRLTALSRPVRFGP